MKIFVIDQAVCNGCYGCQIACKDEHCANDWPGYQKPQPETGHFWCQVKQQDHGQVPRVRVEYKPVMCMQCDEPKCAVTDAVTKREDGLVLIDPEKAVGQREIMEACPYGVIYWNEEYNIPQKCDGCAHLVDAGEIPHCVDLCATGALQFGDYEDFDEEMLEEATQIKPTEDCTPRIYYVNDPKLFIGGGVWDPIDDEVIFNAKITLTFPDGHSEFTNSDHFGDFWFRRIDPGKYHLLIQRRGYKEIAMDIDLTKSLNIGDFEMERIEK